MLNKWLGADKPKKDDFNADNQKIDDACRILSQNAESLAATVAANAATLSSHSANTAAHVTTAEKNSWTGISTTLSAHSSNTTVHVTQAEKNAWTAGSNMVIGSYTGDGAATRKITLGYKPKFCIIFTAADGVGRVVWGTEQFTGNTGFICDLGATSGLETASDGFTVKYSAAGGLDGFTIKFNAPSTKYVYVLWK